MPTFSELSDNALQTSANTTLNFLDNNAVIYGLSPSAIAPALAESEQFTNSLSAIKAAEDARKAATQAKNTNRRELLSKLMPIVRQVYANVAVTDEMLVAAGLAPRPTYGGRTSPKQPLQLTVDALSTGYIRVRFRRNGNTAAAVFLLQTLRPGGGWQTVFSGTRTRFTLQGFTPGEPVTFRVVATLNGETSQPSNQARIYAEDEGDATLDVAA